MVNTNLFEKEMQYCSEALVISLIAVLTIVQVGPPVLSIFFI